MINAEKLPQQTKVELPTELLQSPENGAGPAQLTVTDLQLLAKIIDLASRRGAFQAIELAEVGGVFSKLAAFLAWVQHEEKNKEPKA